MSERGCRECGPGCLGHALTVTVTSAEVEAARYLVRHGDERASVRRIAEAGR